MTRYFYDAEFIERGPGYPIDLISIGIVSEDDRELYLCNDDCDLSVANDWVKANVIPCLPPKRLNLSDPSISPRQKQESLRWKTREQIGKAIVEFMDIDRYSKPQLYGEWCSYDHVVFSQCFGDMMDSPKGFPMRTIDIIQIAEDELGISADELPPSLEVEGKHDALLGARSVKMRWEFLQSCKANDIDRL